jgi:hypothetical protein
MTVNPVAEEAAAHDHVTDREVMIAQISSFSSIGGLPPHRREVALGACREVLERHGADRLTLPLRTQIALAQKRSGDSRGSAG